MDQQTPAANSAAARLSDRFAAVRGFSEFLCEPLSAEDCAVQSMPDVSPTRWHLAHTTWFFETFVLEPRPGYRVFHPEFNYLFNSYYNTVGLQYPRPRRGLLSRPSLAEVREYRRYVDRHMSALLAGGDLPSDTARVVEIGLHHEQQHQELILTDIKHVFSCNPLWPVYREDDLPSADLPAEPRWLKFDEGIYHIGHGGDGFAYDNESPRHRVFLEQFELAGRLVTCGEYLDFISAGGYRRPEFWLSAGWQQVCEHGWRAPLHWVDRDGARFVFTLAGLRPLDPHQPVCHVSYFEADAFAAWAGARLPTETEWEVAAECAPLAGNFADSLLDQGRALHPNPLHAGDGRLNQMFGDVWEWTASPYTPYPGFQTPAGALGEYNGKFMCNQYVLRGGSCVTSQNHIRRTYRNFFPPDARWQFSGIRLAR
jgi:ergothioneine biosynthesis protein EgtB